MKYLPALVLLACGTASAADWQLEPSTVFGLPIGQQLNSSVARCAQPFAENAFRPPKVLCIDAPMGGMATLRGIDLPRVTDTAIVWLANDGAVSKVVVAGHHDAYPRMKAMLVERYGPPSTVSVTKLRTARNVALTGESVLWRGSLVSIDLEEFDSDSQTSVIVFSSNSVAAKRAADDKGGIKAGAAKF